MTHECQICKETYREADGQQFSPKSPWPPFWLCHGCADSVRAKKPIRRWWMLAFAAILLLVLAWPSHAACARVGATSVHRCPSTGDSAADGETVRNYLLNTGNYTCGDTIVLDAGAEYLTPQAGGFSYPIRLLAQSGCTGDKPTRIISSRLNEIRSDIMRTGDVAAADLAAGKYAILRAGGGTAGGGPGCMIELYANGVNNWSIEGVAMLTGDATKTNTRYCYAVAGNMTQNSSLTMSMLPRNITFDRTLCADRMWELYGDVATHTNIEQYFTSLKICYAIDGTNITIKNSTAILQGFDPASDVEVSVSAATAADPVVLTATGIAASFGLVNHASCSGGCTGTCWSESGCKLAAIDGATDAWSDLNGVKPVVYDTADSVKVYVGDSAFLTFTTQFDGTGKGTLAGTVVARRAIIGNLDPMYTIIPGAGTSGFYVLNNWLYSTSGMNIFVGGGTWQGTQKRTTLSSGSTATSINVASTAEMKVGDILANFPNNGSPSTYCPGSGKGCWGSGGGSLRVAKITAINSGTNITVAPWGPAGLDYAPAAGNTLVWDGNAHDGIQIRGNDIVRPYNFAITGKGLIELKGCRGCLIDGNYMKQGLGGNYFITPRNQVGPTPWNRGERLVWSNNLTGNPADSTLGNIGRLVLSGLDDEMTSTVSRDVWMRNNVIPLVKYPSGMENFNGGSFHNGGFVNNTITTHPDINAGHIGWQGGGATCTDDATGYWDGTNSNVKALYNITPYGNNNWATECPLAQTGGTVLGNILTASSPGSQSVATINSRHSGNTALSVADTNTELTGTCDYANWKNCRLKSDSIYRGTATDGGDPGADVYEVEDRLNRWSEKAGLLVPSTEGTPAMVLNAGAWQIGSTFAAARFRLAESTPASGCTVQVFTNRNRSTAHADSSTPQACNRTYSVSNGSTVTYLFGGGTTLTADTLYFYEVIDGGRKMVGEFRTKPAGSGESHTWGRAMECGTDGATFGTAVSAGTAYSVPAGEVRYCRESSPTGAVQALVAP